MPQKYFDFIMSNKRKIPTKSELINHLVYLWKIEAIDTTLDETLYLINQIKKRHKGDEISQLQLTITLQYIEVMKNLNETQAKSHLNLFKKETLIDFAEKSSLLMSMLMSKNSPSESEELEKMLVS